LSLAKRWSMLNTINYLLCHRIINSMGALLETMEVALPSTAVAIAEE